MGKTYLKKFLIIFIFVFSVVCSNSVKSFFVYADSNKIYLGGYPAGFSLQTNGALVVSLCDVVTNDGLKSPAKDASIEPGDKILSINGHKIFNANDIATSIKLNDIVFVEFQRNDEIIQKTLYPAVDLSGEYKLGVFVKDEICGIGTITFIKDNRVASLGHPVMDQDGILNIRGGNIYSCSIIGFVKGSRGMPGELKGVFIKKDVKASIDKNLENGVYGELIGNFDYNNLVEIDIGEAKIGDASIFSTIKGSTPKEYSISIIKIDNSSINKNFVIKITDDELLNETGGIVQGMSGSPIVQDGKLVGAVTHVFINDPTRGFGIKIDNMLNN